MPRRLSCNVRHFLRRRPCALRGGDGLHVTSLGNKTLLALTTRIADSIAMRREGASGDDPFAKVKGLISDMRAGLEESAAADATEK